MVIVLRTDKSIVLFKKMCLYYFEKYYFEIADICQFQLMKMAITHGST